MRKKLSLLAVILLTCGLIIATCTIASGDPILTLHSSNVGIGSLSYSFNSTTNTITINETWTSAAPGFIEITGLNRGTSYTVVKNITNSSGEDFDRIANELLDPLGQSEDTSYDVLPYPAFVPAGFSTSNDNDGLSFAQGSGIPRTSDIWSSLIVDEIFHVRDFLDFYNGVLGTGSTGYVTYGLRENNGTQQPFLLSQRPNESSVNVPEPLTFLLVGTGLAGIGLLRKRFKN